MVVSVRGPSTPDFRPAYSGPRHQWKRTDWDLAATLLGARTSRPPPDASPHTQATALSKALLDTIADSVPISKPKRSEPWRSPWMTELVWTAISEARVAYNLWRTSGRPGSKDYSNRCRLRKRRLIRQAKNAYANRVVNECALKGRLWDAPKRLAGSKPPAIGVLKAPDGSALTSEAEKAQAFADTFSASFGAQPEPSIYEPLPLPLLSRPRPSLQPFSVPEVEKALRKVNGSKAVGPDGVGPLFIKSLAPLVAPSFSVILNRILQTQEFPSTWKHARFIPVPKVPRPARPAQFRPISILCVLPKVAERLLLRRLAPHIQLSRNQFGFRGKSGLTDAWTVLQRVIAQASPRSAAVKVTIVSFDQASAFTVLPHATIFNRLAQEKVPTELINIFKSYFSGRTQSVRVGAAESAPVTVRSGVAQGSLVRPTIFSLTTDSLLRLPFSQGSV